MRATRSYLKVRYCNKGTVNEPSNNKSTTGLFCFSVVSSLVNSLADMYLRAAGFGVTGALSNLLGHVSHGLSLSGAILT